jgi:hypothetical protein
MRKRVSTGLSEKNPMFLNLLFKELCRHRHRNRILKNGGG